MGEFPVPTSPQPNPQYEFCKGMAYCGPQVGMGLVPKGGLKTSQVEGESGAGVERTPRGPPSNPALPHLGL